MHTRTLQNGYVYKYRDGIEYTAMTVLKNSVKSSMCGIDEKLRGMD